MFDSAIHIRRRDVNLTSAPATLRIRFRKTDRTGRGKIVPIPTATDPRFRHLCPVTLLRRLFAAYPSHPDGPLFSLDPRPGHHSFPAKFVISELRRLLALNGIYDQPDGRVYSGHSLQRNAATWAAEIGLSDNDIMHLGRWSDKTMRGGHQRYTEPSIQHKAELARRLMAAPLRRRPRPLGFAIVDDDVDDGGRDAREV